VIHTLAATLALSGLILVVPAARATTTDFRIDPTISHAEFGVRLLWLHTINGQFQQISGHVRRNAAGLATVDAQITLDEVKMSSQNMRSRVLAPDFFDAARYPTIHFISDPVPWSRLSLGGQLPGALTMRGVTLPIRFELQPMHCAAAVAPHCPIKVHGSVSREALGMTSHRMALSDDVQIELMITLDPAPE